MELWQICGSIILLGITFIFILFVVIVAIMMIKGTKDNFNK